MKLLSINSYLTYETVHRSNFNVVKSTIRDMTSNVLRNIQGIIANSATTENIPKTQHTKLSIECVLLVGEEATALQKFMTRMVGQEQSEVEYNGDEAWELYTALKEER